MFKINIFGNVFWILRGLWLRDIELLSKNVGFSFWCKKCWFLKCCTFLIIWLFWLTVGTFETNGGNKRFGDFVATSSGKTAGFLATGGSTFGAFHSTSLMLANLRLSIRSVGVWKRCPPTTSLNVKVAISQISLESAKNWHFCCVVACRRTFTPIRTIVYLSIQLWPAFLQWTSDDILI